ncbi:hypothetical protein ABEB36_003223 [Hypothenemus hampei]|uniref:Beclin 1-associated autophagy-related key regulator n=1 Tax=Hypothenemus hampei TaxID=57062 RepID=A0ABD1F8V1_HYPHA
MTTISSEDSNTAPRIFHISPNEHVSSFVSSNSSDSSNVRHCPLCKKFKKVFYCKDCIYLGHISNTRNNESLSGIKENLEELIRNKENYESSCLKILKSLQDYDILRTKVRQGKERTRIIRLALEEKRQKRQVLKQRLADLKAKNQGSANKTKAYKTKSEALGDCVSKKLEEVSSVKSKLQDTYVQVRKFSRLRVDQLFKYIFPITEVKPTVEMESSGDSTVKELAEASQTNYLKDMWVYTDYSNETQFSVVAPCLPGSGNYYNYNLWAHNRDGMYTSVDTDVVEINPALTISGALTYTTQLVNVLAFLLNVRLPYKLSYSEFSSICLKERQFSKRVARLNANILYLCISQKIDSSVLSPTLTIHNILKFRDHESADLGNQNHVEINDSHANAFENAISSDLKSAEDSDSDEGDSFTVEWEAVPHVECPEALPGPVQSSVINPQQASSMAGGLMNSAVASVTSFWRGFTGR